MLHQTILDGVVELIDYADATVKSAKFISTAEAFRKHDWLGRMPLANSSGNFRGMVVSAKWATVFHFTTKAIKPVEKVAGLASLAANLSKAKSEMDRIVTGNDDWMVKGARLSTQVSSVCLRTAFGSVPFAAHLISKSLGGYLQLADLAGIPKAGSLNTNLVELNHSIQDTFHSVTDGDKMYLLVNKYLVYR